MMCSSLLQASCRLASSSSACADWGGGCSMSMTLIGVVNERVCEGARACRSCSRLSNDLSTIADLFWPLTLASRSQLIRELDKASVCNTLAITQAGEREPQQAHSEPQGDSGQTNEVPSLALHRP